MNVGDVGGDPSGRECEVVGVCTVDGGQPCNKVTVEYEDGSRAEFDGGVLGRFRPFEVEIPGAAYWRFTYAPYGTGMALLVDRGIACADHTQTVSAHTTNCVSVWRARKVMEKVGAEYAAAIDRFVQLVRLLKGPAADSIGDLFCGWLARDFADRCERESQ